MKQRKIKVKCTKRKAKKCNEVLRTYDMVQEAYASKLENSEAVASFKCNVPIEDDSVGDFTTDFVITRMDGSIAVRECVIRKNLLKPRMVKLLDFSQRYWRSKGVYDWKVIVNAEE